MTRVYEEIVEFIAAGPSPDGLVAFRPSADARARVAELLRAEKEGTLSAEDKAELDHDLQLEHLMRLVKAQARKHISNE
jgi:hypothetical protein